MVTVRTYWSRDRAVMAKLLLEEYDVSCALIHENANNFYPFAMPVRLIVTEDQVDRAIRILDGNLADIDEAAENERSVEVRPNKEITYFWFNQLHERNFSE